jgi:antirestriction protein ArdC
MLNKNFKEAVDKIIAAMEKNGTKWKKSWVNVQPQNLSTGKTYKGFNALLLPLIMMDRGHKSPFFLTFNQAKELGGKVKKGSKSYPVFFYKFYFKVDVVMPSGVGTTLDIPAFSEKEAIKIASKKEGVKVEVIVGKNPFMVEFKIFNLDDIE